MRTTIYQINTDRDEKRVKFISLDYLERLQGSPKPNPNIYDKICESTDSFKHLEEIYEKFNVDYPSDYRGHSLSVSDIVEVSGSPDIPEGFYFCDSFGFKKIEFGKERCEMNAEQMELESRITVLVVEPGKYPKLMNISDSLEAMQEVVGGNIEEYMPFDDEVAIICNEEGKICGKELNRAIYDERGELADVIAGKFFICYAPFESERFLSLPKDLENKYREKFKYPERFSMQGQQIKVTKFKPVSKEVER